MANSISKAKTPEYVFNTMALTIREPQNPGAYRDSCLFIASSALAAGNLKPEDEIVLLGSREDVYHAIVVDGNNILTDSLRAPDGPATAYNAASGLYEGRFGPQPATLRTLAKMTVADFEARYLSPEMK